MPARRRHMRTEETKTQLPDRLELKHARIDWPSWKMPGEYGIIGRNESLSTYAPVRNIDRCDPIDEQERMAVRNHGKNRIAIYIDDAPGVDVTPQNAAH